jgi:hypothetical protein
MLLTEVRQALETGLARRASGGQDVWFLDTGPWWHLFRDFQRLEVTKLDVLRATWRLPKPLFLVPQEPLEPELAEFLNRDGTAWRVDKTKGAGAFYRTEPASGLGNWQMYAAERPLTVSLPDTFRTRPEKVLTFMAEQNVNLLIDVFHDDTDWCIALLEPDSHVSAA